MGHYATRQARNTISIKIWSGLVERLQSRMSDCAHFHIARIRALTSIRICWALRSEAAADTSGQVAVSKNCSNVAGMKRVLAA